MCSYYCSVSHIYYIYHRYVFVFFCRYEFDVCFLVFVSLAYFMVLWSFPCMFCVFFVLPQQSSNVRLFYFPCSTVFIQILHGVNMNTRLRSRCHFSVMSQYIPAERFALVSRFHFRICKCPVFKPFRAFYMSFLDNNTTFST